ncbi:MAG: metallophosphoesterase [Clostridia bacterium]
MENKNNVINKNSMFLINNNFNPYLNNNYKQQKRKQKVSTRIFVSCALCFLSLLFFFGGLYARMPLTWKNPFSQSLTIKSQNSKSIETNDDFNILQINDLHFSFLLSAPLCFTLAQLDTIIKQSKPNFIVLNGDIVWNLFNKAMLNFVAMYFESKQIPWTFVFGNHDEEFGVEKTKLVLVLNGLKYCKFDIGFSNLGGAGNHAVYVNDGLQDLKYVMYFFDSQQGTILPKQVEWFNWSQNKLNNPKNLVFMHHPLKQVKTAVRKNNFVGIVKEPVSNLLTDSQLFNSLKTLNTKGVFNGHDHANDVMFDLDNIHFHSCRGSSYSGYTRDGADRGATLISVTNTSVSSSTILFN